eukprot:160913_1
MMSILRWMLLPLIAYTMCFGSAQFRFINTYGDYMVLQQSGTDSKQRSTINGVSMYANDKVTLKLSTMADQGTIIQTKTVTVVNTTWQIILDPVAASNKEYYIQATSTANASEKITLSNVLFGDVYICSGQSNMQFTVDSAFNYTQSLAEANNYPNIRLFTAQDEQSTTEITELIKIEQIWSIASNTSVGGGNWSYFSAVCWFFGKNLYDKLQYPMGLIATDWGGTPIRDWMSKDALAKCPNETSIDTDSNISKTIDNLHGPSGPSILYNAMIYPFTTMTIRGAIWYQGEADSGASKYAYSYECAFKYMISDWRLKWSIRSETSNNFPFGFVQISVWDDHNNNTCGNTFSQCIGVPIVRWAQTGNLGYLPNAELPNVFGAISMDLGDPTSPYGDVHPRYKQQMANRLSDAALNLIYGQKDVYWFGPVANNTKCNVDSNTKKATIDINFSNVNSQGLLMKNPTGFEYYNSTSKLWVYIKEDIFSVTNNGMSIQFTLDDSHVSQIRYAFYQAPCMPVVGIYNCAVYDKKALLPAAGFIKSVQC